MRELTGAERKYLRGLAHDLKPIVQIGRGGASPAVRDSLDTALRAHELVKVRFVGHKDERGGIVAELAGSLGAAVVGEVGHVAIVFRPNPDPADRVLALPFTV